MPKGEGRVPTRRRTSGPGRVFPLAAWLGVMAALSGCPDPGEPQDVAAAEEQGAASGKEQAEPSPAAPAEHEMRAAPGAHDTRPPPMKQPVPLWEKGRTERMIDAATAWAEGYVVLDLGEAWTPYLFTERASEDEEPVPHPYRETYLALARGEYPPGHQGERARQDKYLELYGIPPTLGLLRKRFHAVREQGCDKELDLAPLQAFEGFASYKGNPAARKDVADYRYLKRQVERMMRAQGVSSPEELDRSRLDDRDKPRLRRYLKLAPKVEAVRAAQRRLVCEGYMKGKGRFVEGGLDWATHQALAEFERRHRIYGWGFLGRETLEALRQPGMELERRAVVRVLTERAMLAAGVIEDGSTSTRPDGSPRTWKGADGQEHPIPNLEEALRRRVVEAFGLQTPESTLAWLEGLGELPPEAHRYVAFRGVELPEYYDGEMDLQVVVDRGDVWYEFPFDEQGNARPQPVQRRPRLTVFVRYLEQRIPLARFGTTIGGWRSELVDGVVMWKYKNSPVGPRVWARVVAAPVWMPPEGTPARDLLKRDPRGEGKDRYYINYHETGPSYASAYGLVAAYHRKYRRDAEGNILLGGDEGIRTHGTVDYMSIMRRHSHGCHRLHNHIAVRLMSFVLAHRAHRRLGAQAISYRLPLQYQGYEYLLKLDQGGYVFELDHPLPVVVLEGRIRGRRRTPIEHPLPKFDKERGGYFLRDGTQVVVDRLGNVTPVAPGPDGGLVRLPVPDGGLPLTGRPQDEASGPSGAPAGAVAPPAAGAPTPTTAPSAPQPARPSPPAQPRPSQPAP